MGTANLTYFEKEAGMNNCQFEKNTCKIMKIVIT